MRIFSESFEDGERIPDRCAFCIPDPADRVKLGPNENPHLAWSEVPQGARSLAIVCTDPDAPSVGDDVNQPDRAVAHDLPRADFHHWAIIDLASDLGEIAAGSCSAGVTAGGKSQPPGPPGARQGVNDYTSWFAGDPDMAGTYRGYDGPAPPWNDERVHRYRFRLFALDLERVPVDGDFTAPQVLAAIGGHVLAEAMITGTYTLNPRLR